MRQGDSRTQVCPLKISAAQRRPNLNLHALTFTLFWPGWSGISACGPVSALNQALIRPIRLLRRKKFGPAASPLSKNPLSQSLWMINFS